MGLPPEFTLRAVRDEDAAPIAAFVNEESQASLGVSVWTAEELVSDWNAPGTDRERDCIVVETVAGIPCGYASVECRPPHVEVFAIIAAARATRELGLEAALVAESERLASRFLELAPPGRRVVLHQGTLASDASLHALLARRGYVHARSFDVMRIDFPVVTSASRAPAAVDVHPMDPARIDLIYAAHVEAFGDHWGESVDTLDGFRHYALDETQYVPELWLVAWCGGEVAGYVGARPRSREDERRGFIAALGVRPQFRRRGIAALLLRRAFAALDDRGSTGCDLVVDRDSLTGATRLYERVGMTAQPRFATWERELRPSRAARAAPTPAA